MGRGSKEPIKWWHMRTNMEKTLIMFSALLVITFIITLLVGITLRGSNSESEEKSKSDSYCMTVDCLKTAGHVLYKLNSTVHPCDNFYDFACGQFMQTHSVPVDHHVASIDQKNSDAVRLTLKHWLESDDEINNSAYRDAKILYDSCIEFDKPKGLYKSMVQNLFKEQNLEDWPVLDTYWDKKDVKLEQSLASLSLLGIPVLFQIDVIPDSQKKGRYILKISPGSPALTTFTEQEARESLALKSYVTSVLRLLDLEGDAVLEAQSILDVEFFFIRLKEVADSECGLVEEDGHELGSTVMTFAEMDARIHGLNWTLLMNNILNSIKIKSPEGSSFPIHVDKAQVFCRKHIRDAIVVLEDQHEMSVLNYLGWRFLFPFIQYLGQPFYRLHLHNQEHMIKDLHGYLPQPRWKVCLSLLERHLLPILGNVYRKQAVSGAVLKEKMKIAAHVRTSLSDRLSSASWLTERDKQKIKQKVTTTKFNITLAEFFLNEDAVNDWFSNLTLHLDTLIQNILRIRKFETTHALERLISPSKKILDWDNSFLTSPTHPVFQGNSIIIHFEKIIPPYLQLERPSYLNYGAFGTVLSRELLEYIDFQNFSKVVEGKKKNIFWDLISCSVTEKYILDANSEGEEIMNSLLTELSAVEVSLSAYNSRPHNDDIHLPGLDYNKEQMFFLSYAQTNCEVREEIRPKQTKSNLQSSVRVNYVMENIPKFGEVFGCPANSPMNPSSKCRIWN